MNAKKRNVIRPRWRKVLADLWDNKTRTLLVVLSIAAGVFAIGTILSAITIMSEDMGLSYASVNPANIIITTDPFDEKFLATVENMAGVEHAEGRNHITASVILKGKPAKSLELVAFKDFGDSRIGLLEPKEGRSVPDDNEMVLRFNTMNNPGYQIGQVLTVELSDGTRRQIPVAGYVVDQGSAGEPTQMHRGYVNYDDLAWLGEGSYFDRVLVTVDGNKNSDANIAAVAKAIEKKVENSGRTVHRTITAKSNLHPMNAIFTAIFGIFALLGLLVLVLSGSLIFNTLNALLTQNQRQIGIMKLIGARSGQIFGMYLILILLFGFLSLVIAVPAAMAAGYALSNLLASLLDAQLQGFRVIPMAVGIQVILALLVPLVAGFFPINRGARTTVHQALSDDGPGAQPADGGLWQRLGKWTQWLSRPVLLSLRNTFRRRGRLVLTLFTLVVAGATFIAVFNVQVSMQAYMNQMMQHFLADLTLTLERPYRISGLEQTVLEAPGVTGIEAWSGTSAEALNANDVAVNHVQISASPLGSELVDVVLSEGRWLLPEDDKAIVISEAIRTTHPRLKPGDAIKLSMADGTTGDWTVVGMFSFPAFIGDPLAYVPITSLSNSRHAPSRAAAYRLSTDDKTVEGQQRVGATLDQHLRTSGYSVNSLQTGAELRGTSLQTISIIIVFLVFMALLTAFVGSIGLMGTMSMNVMERTREIGVMRAIGATDSKIVKSVIIEGAFIGLLSWAISVPFSFPLTYLFLNIISTSMGISSIDITFTMQGTLIWLVVVVVLTILASIWPARNAAHLTIREVLAYE